ncbi:conserved hypothetical protein [Vibrio crassostreae]|uniref:Uncharacterized protein n=1 Tax=Vibrio crassostreae TaxID=246167 RepID=A0A822MNV6_9VIBR|nr:conserved hypothetical protein [Vibrio crassostreae]CAK1785133.1 conserved hypothetical protein [Vibrio crassostreae]CAK1792323.1 conserved hypothetical protein [Vibrio crassostreae]CAK1800461.1 conserved hypothetical protein [Vibrio crassostreae]CAK1801199.1 conserved hypothetical protein [Vibrio crassostreae]
MGEGATRQQGEGIVMDGLLLGQRFLCQESALKVTGSPCQCIGWR